MSELILTLSFRKYFFDLLKKFEGLKLKSYKCPSGVYTIGYGHTKDVKPTDKITIEVADRLLQADVELVEAQLLVVLPCFKNLAEHERYALTSLTYNIGIGNFRKSSFPRLITEWYNAGVDRSDGINMYHFIGSHFLDFNKANGKVLNGLTKRRNAEMALWLGKRIKL